MIPTATMHREHLIRDAGPSLNAALMNFPKGLDGLSAQEAQTRAETANLDMLGYISKSIGVGDRDVLAKLDGLCSQRLRITSLYSRVQNQPIAGGDAPPLKGNHFEQLWKDMRSGMVELGNPAAGNQPLMAEASAAMGLLESIWDKPEALAPERINPVLATALRLNGQRIKNLLGNEKHAEFMLAESVLLGEMARRIEKL